MNPRFLILLVIAAALAVYLATRTSTPRVAEPVEGATGDRVIDPDLTAEQRNIIGDEQKTLSEYPLPGNDPAVPPELDIDVEVDPTGKKNRLYFYIREKHGYYVETFDIDFYFKKTPDAPEDTWYLAATTHLNDYLKANETLKGCIEVVWAELKDIGGEMETSENWVAEVSGYGRARAQNPKEFRRVSEKGKCR